MFMIAPKTPQTAARRHHDDDAPQGCLQQEPLRCGSAPACDDTAFLRKRRLLCHLCCELVLASTIVDGRPPSRSVLSTSDATCMHAGGAAAECVIITIPRMYVHACVIFVYLPPAQPGSGLRYGCCDAPCLDGLPRYDGQIACQTWPSFVTLPTKFVLHRTLPYDLSRTIQAQRYQPDR